MSKIVWSQKNPFNYSPPDHWCGTGFPLPSNRAWSQLRSKRVWDAMGLRSKAMQLKVKGLISDFQWQNVQKQLKHLWTMGPQWPQWPRPKFLPRHAVAAISSSCKRFNHARSRWNLKRYQQNAQKHSCCIFLQDEFANIFTESKRPFETNRWHIWHALGAVMDLQSSIGLPNGADQGTIFLDS